LIQQLRERIEALEKKNRNLEQENQRLRERIEALEKKNRNLEEDNREIRKQNNELKQKINKLTEKMQPIVGRRFSESVRKKVKCTHSYLVRAQMNYFDKYFHFR
jgi:predicted nuclease with TOPRIM domain